jgi:hypothetical protein
LLHPKENLLDDSEMLLAKESLMYFNKLSYIKEKSSDAKRQIGVCIELLHSKENCCISINCCMPKKDCCVPMNCINPKKKCFKQRKLLDIC